MHFFGGVRPTSQNPYLIYDQNLHLWLDQKFDGWKTLPFGAAHTTHIGEYPPGISDTPTGEKCRFTPASVTVLSSYLYHCVI